MILTCPECATRYFLPDMQVGRAGRSVKCTQCGHVWRVEPEPEPEPPAPEPEPELEPEPPVFPDPEEEFAAAAQRRAEILRLKKEAAERKARQAAAITAAVWAGVAAAIALCLVAAAVFRIQMVKWWPGTASAYAAIGLPVNASGLLLDKVQAAPAVVQGHRALVITGVLTNASADARNAPAFRVAILDAAGKPIKEAVIQVAPTALKVGEARRFQLQVADPPPAAKDVEVTLAVPDAVPAKASATGKP